MPTYRTSPLLSAASPAQPARRPRATRYRPGSIQNPRRGNLSFSAATPRSSAAEIQSAVTAMLGHAEAAAQIDHGRTRGTARRARASSSPVSVQLSTLKIRCRCAHAARVTRSAGAPRQLDQLIRLAQRHAEFGLRTGGAHVVMMAAPDAGIDPHEDRPGRETAPATSERIEIVQRDPARPSRSRTRIRCAARNWA